MRWTFPQDRLVYSFRTGSPLYPVTSGTPMVIYLDEACTQPANIQDDSGTALLNSTVMIGDDTLIPLFLGPDTTNGSDVTLLWGLPSGATEPYRLDAVLGDRLDQIESTQSVDVTTLVRTNDARLTDARTPTAHVTTHKTGGSDALAPADIGAAATTHTHAESDVTELASDLDNKADKTHTHVQTDVSQLTASLGLRQQTSAKGQANGYASLDSTGKVPVAQLPASVTTPPNLTGYQLTSAKGAVNGYASLGSDGKVPSSQLPAASAPGIHSINGLTGTSVTLTLASLGGITSAPLANYQLLSGKGQPSGYAALDSTGKVPSAQLPAPQSLANYVLTTDTRLSNARTPTAHAATHKTGGSDALTPTGIGAAPTVHTHQQTDIVNLTASLTARLTETQSDARYVQSGSRGVAGGVPTLDNNAKVPTTQIPDLSATYVSSAALVNFQNVSGKGAANGYAALDSTSKIPIAQIPSLSSLYVAASALSGLQATSARNAANGYAGLDANSKLTASQIPDLSSTYAPLGNLTSYQLASGRNAINGYAGLDASGKVALGQLPDLSSSYVVQNDTRLTNARTPTPHSTTHAVGGSDALTPDAIGAASVGALSSYQLITAINQAGGYAGLDVNAKVALANLPIIELNPGDDIPPGLPDGTIVIWKGSGSGGGDAPAGGTTGQILHKNSDTDFDTSWFTLTADALGALTQAAADARYVTSVNGHDAGDVVLTLSELGAVATTDSRLSDARTPTAHATSHAAGGADALTPAAIGALTQTQADARYLQAAPVTSVNSQTGAVTLTAAALGAITQTTADSRYALTTDNRLTNARTPTPHASTHAVGGSDPISISSVGLMTAKTWRRRDLPDPLLADGAYAGAAPTLTLTQQSTSTISSAQTIAPDTGPFTYMGASEFQYGTGTPWSNYYGAKSRIPHTYTPNFTWAQSVWAVEFGCDAQLLELRFIAAAVGDATNIAVQVFVDGRKLTDTPVYPATWAGGTMSLGFGQVLKIDLGSADGAKPRRWRIAFFNCPFGGIYLPSTATMWKVPSMGGRLIGFGDSITDGSNGNSGAGAGTWLYRCARLLGVSDVWDQAKGGTGYVNAGTSDTLPHRVAGDVGIYNPDRVIVFGGYNDQPQNTTAAISSAATTTFSALNAISSKPDVFVIGCWSGAATPAGSVVNTDNALLACATTAGFPFISPVTGNVYNAAGTLLDSTGPWITAANVAGYISTSFSPHPTDAGHAYVARRIAEAMTTILSY